MKIETIELKEMNIVNVNGEFTQVFGEEKKVPCFLTNHAMKKAKDAGLINSSLIGDLLKLMSFESLDIDNNFLNDPSVFDNLDELAMQKTIYIAYKGANKNSELDFDSFLELYHYSFMETVSIYTKLVQPFIANDPNLFAEGLQKSTKKEKKE